MKKNFLVFIVMCFAIGASAQNGAYIEYKTTSSMGAIGSTKINLSEFGSVTEFNITIPQIPSGGTMHRILSKKSNPDVIYMIDDKNKTYTESNIPATSSEDSKNYVVTRKDDEIVNGYKSVHTIVSDGKETYEIWNTKDIPDYNKYSEAFNSNERFGSPKKEQALKAKDCDGMPVKIVCKGDEREDDITIELVKFEKKNFMRSYFEIPAGYSKSESASTAPSGMPEFNIPEESMKMTPEERTQYDFPPDISEEMKKKYGK
jgi:hypothetical protein